MSTLIAAPFNTFSDLSALPLPEVESWFDHPAEFSQTLSVNSSTSLTAVSSTAALTTSQLHRQSSIFPSVSAGVAEKRESAADLNTQAPHLMSLESNTKTSLVDDDASVSAFFQQAANTAANHLSPFSDASTPSEFEHPHSPFSPHHCQTNQACCAHTAATFPTVVLGANEDSDSRSTSPSLPSDDELSQINQNLQDEKLETPQFPASIAPQPNLFPALNLNSSVASETQNSKPLAIAAAKQEVQRPKAKRSRRRNLIRALKEQGGDENLSGSEGEQMSVQATVGPTRSKRSYIALLGDEGKVVDEEEEDAKAASGSKRDRNKASASAYRKRRKIYLDTLESRVASLNERLKEKDEHMAKMESENRVLREQVSFLKRLINFKASDEDELKEATKSASSEATSSASSTAFGASNSRLNFGQFTTNGSSRHASVFLFLLFSCFLLFNPMWTGMDLSGGLSDSASAGGLPLAGRAGRSLLSLENAPAGSVAPHPFLLSTAVVKEVNEAAQLQYLQEAAAKKAMDLPSIKDEHNSSATATSSSAAAVSSSSSAGSAAVSSDHANAWHAMTQLAQQFDMDPTSQQFAELVASAYLPLVSMLGEAATQAALRDLANGVFFVQHHALLQAVTHAATTNATFSK